ncbi:adenine phosphoribosyltransferase [Candidatus Wirthbacteria bacterium CG2_30_54_11]|uniref:Adenine phosphoribosyltransferase n=1 Tax=Candidatus Wirthbacteria bacterium CG2_30_54_11 TaxID=1817892 RepID=A0A1J5IKH5_9BACT|nr:MAG: adenine phosphoribosyltransferase [Candidatus Wirthbacteria bacterium CG2_30_54_11]
MSQLKDTIQNVPDFPHPPVMFRDITTLLKKPDALKEAIDRMKAVIDGLGSFDLIVGIESRGFIFGMPLAYLCGKGFVLVRKKDKLPREKISVTYATEYGPDVLELHRDAIAPGQNVVLVDDLLATGGSARAACSLIEQLGGQVTACVFLNELCYLPGREALKGQDVRSVIPYEPPNLLKADHVHPRLRFHCL